MRDPFPVLVLGGTGVFGSRICRRLARHGGLRIFIGGRSPAKIRRLVREIREDSSDSDVRCCIVNLPDDLPVVLDETAARLVIHTCGPFQGQDYRVPEICIDKGVHYLDLADDREFVSGFGRLNRRARRKGVLAVSGVSSVPALSSAVVEDLKPAFARLDEISIGITPGIRSPRGLAVVEGILSYTGKLIPRWQDGAWRQVHGWQDMRRRSLSTSRMGRLGTRWFAACDVPDNALFPEAYPDVRAVAFRAGLELSLLHWGLWFLSWLVRWRVIANLRPYARVLRDLAALFAGCGSDRGGMFVDLVGLDADGCRVGLTWTLLAEAGDGPWVPCLPAVVLTRKLARGEITARGAFPCLGFLSLAEFGSEVEDLRVDTEVSEVPIASDRRRLERNDCDPSPSPSAAK